MKVNEELVSKQGDLEKITSLSLEASEKLGDKKKQELALVAHLDELKVEKIKLEDEVQQIP